MYRVLFTGSREWTNKKRIEQAFDEHVPYDPLVTIVHGDCPRGLDHLVDRYAKHLGLLVESHPADWDKYGKAAGMKRNQDMVDLGADICLAFPLPGSRGTLHCMTRAKAAGIRVVNYGRLEE